MWFFLDTTLLVAFLVGLPTGFHIWERALSKSPNFRRKYHLGKRHLNGIKVYAFIPILVNFWFLPTLQDVKSALIGVVLGTMFAYILDLAALCFVYIQDASASSNAT